MQRFVYCPLLQIPPNISTISNGLHANQDTDIVILNLFLAFDANSKKNSNNKTKSWVMQAIPNFIAPMQSHFCCINWPSNPQDLWSFRHTTKLLLLCLQLTLCRLFHSLCVSLLLCRPCLLNFLFSSLMLSSGECLKCWNTSCFTMMMIMTMLLFLLVFVILQPLLHLYFLRIQAVCQSLMVTNVIRSTKHFYNELRFFSSRVSLLNWSWKKMQ